MVVWHDIRIYDNEPSKPSMANYKFIGNIVVEGARSQKDAINQLQVMLNDYEDMNPNHKDITIHWDTIEKTN